MDPFAPPRAAVRHPGAASRLERALIYAQSIATGLILGLIDIHMYNGVFLLIRLAIYSGVAGFQGWQYGRKAIASALLLGSSLAPIQMVAIGCGYRAPYVCRTQGEAAFLLVLNIPCLGAFFVGWLTRDAICRVRGLEKK